MGEDERLIWLYPDDFETFMDALTDPDTPKSALVELLSSYTFVTGSAQKPTWPEIKSREISSSHSPNVKNTSA